MKSYGEIECVFISHKFSIENVLNVCKLLIDLRFDLNTKSPGYIYGDDFEYPEWNAIGQAIEQIKKGGLTSFCINFISQRNCIRQCTLIVEKDRKCIRVKADEENFVDKETNTINRSAFYDFIDLVQKIAPYLNVSSWKIAQSDFEFDPGDGDGFIDYIDGIYSDEDINKLITWYDSEYLSRWN